MYNSFEENISNEDVQKLSQGVFGGEIIIIDQESQIAPACKELSAHSIIGFDTETRPTFKPGPLNKVALLQLSTPERCYLFKLSQVPLKRPIIKLLESKSILKIGADVKGDIQALQELRRFRPRGFVELQSIISQWGVAEKSVRKMAAIVLGVRVSKAQRLSNWESNTLTQAQKMYAATDAWICAEIFVKLNATQKRELMKPEPDNKVKSEGGSKNKKRVRKTPQAFRKRSVAEVEVNKEFGGAVSALNGEEDSPISSQKRSGRSKRVAKQEGSKRG